MPASHALPAPLVRTLKSVGGVLTEVVTLTTPERSLGPAIVVFPGNPGLISYYEPYMLSLSVLFPTASVHGISHAGHSPHTARPCNGKLFSLSEQVNHKAAFVAGINRERLAAGANGPLVVVGHSVGAFMAMRVLETRPDVKIDKVLKIFPTLMDFPDCCGNVIPVLIRPFVRNLIALVASLLGFLPHWILTGLILMAQPKMRTGHPNALASTLELATSGAAARNVLYLAGTEHEDIRDFNWESAERNAHRVVYLFGQKDRWGPVSHYERVSRRFSGLRGARVEMDGRGMTHDFVVAHSGEAALETQRLLADVPGLSDASQGTSVTATATTTPTTTADKRNDSNDDGSSGGADHGGSGNDNNGNNGKAKKRKGKK